MERASDAQEHSGAISAGSVTPEARGRFEAEAAQLNDRDGVSICIDCGLVFEPRAKHGAKRCELCNRSSTAPPLWQPVEHPDGRGWSVAGVFGVHHFRKCEACEETFPAGTSATLYCMGDSACRRGRSSPQNPGTVGWTPAYRDAIRRAHEAQVDAQLAAWRGKRAGQPALTSADLVAEIKAQRKR